MAEFRVYDRVIFSRAGTPRVYQQEDLPRFLRADQVLTVLEAVDRSSLQGIRDYSILMFLVMYGVRAAEVARMTLDDVNWETEKLRLRNRKSGRTDWLPLSRPVGDALLEYLKVRPRWFIARFSSH